MKAQERPHKLNEANKSNKVTKRKQEESMAPYNNSSNTTNFTLNEDIDGSTMKIDSRKDDSSVEDYDILFKDHYDDLDAVTTPEWVEELYSIAPTESDLRLLDLETLKSVIADARPWEQEKILCLYANVEVDKSEVPKIRSECKKAGISLEAAKILEEQGVFSMKDMTEANIQSLAMDMDQIEGKTSSSFGNRLRSAVTEEKKRHREEENWKARDIERRQWEADQASWQEKENVERIRQETLELLDGLNVASMQEKDSEAVQRSIEELKAKVSAPSNFDQNGQQLKGYESLQAKLEQGGALFSQTNSAPGVFASYDDDKSLVAAASGGLALCGIGFVVEEDQAIVPSTLPMLSPPEYVTNLGTFTPFTSNVFRTTEEAELSRFQNTASAAGMSMAESTTKSWAASATVKGYGANVSAGHSETHQNNASSAEENNTEENRSVNSVSSTAHLAEYITMPMQSFRIPRSAMKLSDEAKRELRKVNTTLKAKAFLRKFGSHIPCGRHTMGGVFFRNISLISQTECDTQQLFTAAGSQMAIESGHAAKTEGSAGGSYYGITASASASMSSAVKTGSTDVVATANNKGEATTTQKAYFQSSVMCMGPNATTPQEFATMLNSNRRAWACIDRGNAASLIPVWELVEDEKEEIGSDWNVAATYLRSAWLRTAEKWKAYIEAEFPRSLFNLIDDNFKEDELIDSLVKNICRVVVIEDRIKLEKLNEVIKEASAVMKSLSQHPRSRRWWIKDFIQLASKTTGIDVILAHDVAQYHNDAALEASHLSGSNWDKFAESFLPIAEDFLSFELDGVENETEFLTVRNCSDIEVIATLTLDGVKHTSQRIIPRKEVQLRPGFFNESRELHISSTVTNTKNVAEICKRIDPASVNLIFTDSNKSKLVLLSESELDDMSIVTCQLPQDLEMQTFLEEKWHDENSTLFIYPPYDCSISEHLLSCPKLYEEIKKKQNQQRELLESNKKDLKIKRTALASLEKDDLMCVHTTKPYNVKAKGPTKLANIKGGQNCNYRIHKVDAPRLCYNFNWKRGKNGVGCSWEGNSMIGGKVQGVVKLYAKKRDFNRVRIVQLKRDIENLEKQIKKTENMINKTNTTD